MRGELRRLGIFYSFLGCDFRAYVILFCKGFQQKGDQVRKRLFLISCILNMALVASGCAPLIIGGAIGAVGGYAISKDTVQVDIDKPYDSLWASAVSVSDARGIIRLEDPARGRIELDAEKSKVRINITRLTKLASRIRVSARKYHLPNISLAEDICMRVIDGAK